MSKSPWIIEQHWRHILFLHWRVNPVELQPLLPFKLDLFHGDAVLSIVPLRIEDIRFPFTPSLPWLSKVTGLWELNLRTYVTVGGKRGIYFFTLDTGNCLGTWIANQFFHLPYRVAQIEANYNNKKYQLTSRRKDYFFSLTADISGNKKNKTELDIWATERYLLFTQDKNKTYEGRVIHKEWPLEDVDDLTFEDQFSKQLPVNLKGPPESLSYAHSLVVQFEPFKMITNPTPIFFDAISK